MAGKLGVMSPEEIAEELQVHLDIVLDYFESGQLRGFRPGGQWRTTEEAVRRLIDELSSAASLHTRGQFLTKSDMEENLTMQDLNQGWDTINDGFPFYWPGESEPEKYDVGFKRTIRNNGKNIPLVIGLGNRFAAGRERRRAVVFWGDPDGTMYPVVEFTGSNDFDDTKRMASVIKIDGRKQLKLTDDIPEPYHVFRTDVYNRVVSGAYASGSRCIVANENDLGAMAMHALLRSQQKGWI